MDDYIWQLKCGHQDIEVKWAAKVFHINLQVFYLVCEEQ